MENKNNLATTAKEVMVPRENVLTCTKKSKLFPILQKMDSHNYSHVLILDGDVVCGILSEKTILTIAATKGSLLINEDDIVLELDTKTNVNEDEEIDKDTIKCIENYVSFKQASLEHFFEYISPDTPLNEVKELFARIEKNKERVDILIVTEEGRASGNFLGIITPWEIL